MNWIDIVALATVCFLLCFGFKRGLIREVGSLLAVLLALVLALLTVPFSFRVLHGVESFPQKWTPWVIALVVFLLLLFLFQTVVHLIHRVVHSTPLGLVDRVGGAGFGGLKGLVTIGFLLLILSLLPLPGAVRAHVNGSFLYSAVQRIRPKLGRLEFRFSKKGVERKLPSGEEGRSEKERR